MSPIDAASRVRISANVYSRAFGEELVLLDFGSGEYFALDDVGALIFRALESGASIGDAAAAIARRYEVEREVAIGDIVPLVAQLRDHGLLTVVADESC